MGGTPSQISNWRFAKQLQFSCCLFNNDELNILKQFQLPAHQLSWSCKPNICIHMPFFVNSFCELRCTLWPNIGLEPVSSYMDIYEFSCTNIFLTYMFSLCFCHILYFCELCRALWPSRKGADSKGLALQEADKTLSSAKPSGRKECGEPTFRQRSMFYRTREIYVLQNQRNTFEKCVIQNQGWCNRKETRLFHQDPSGYKW